jgi:glycosyltransferase involved in cell wall biosynthesis
VSRPLCIVLPEIGLRTETFIRWDVAELLPGGTVVVADPPPAGESVLEGPVWDVGDCPVLAFSPIAGDPPPDRDRVAAVAGFLQRHRVEVVLVEYLDFADRWIDHLLGCGVRVWLRGHGVDLSARLDDERWRSAYRRYRTATGVIVPTRTAAGGLCVSGLGRDTVHVVPYAVDIPPLTAGSQRAGERPLRCVAAGRLVPKKAPLLVLESFRLAAERDDRLTLELIGDGPLRADVSRYLREQNLSHKVTVRGSLPHQQTLESIRSADLFVHHAVRSPVDGDAEGLPLVLLEAMAAAVPVVTTSHAGIPEIVQDHVTGRLVAEGDVAGMASAMVDLAARPDVRRRIGGGARKLVVERHSPDAVRETLLSLLQPGTPNE